MYKPLSGYCVTAFVPQRLSLSVVYELSTSDIMLFCTSVYRSYTTLFQSMSICVNSIHIEVYLTIGCWP